MAASQQQQARINTDTSSFGGADADLAARLTGPTSPTTERAAEEARRRTSTSEWKPPIQRTASFDHEEYKRQMMSSSGTLEKDHA
ncbi:hypothetical protein KVR01_003991 [Diaporthe batatas]|uniref:uncharacterized protein n=1 Tax=Diaporthe batatas TaxID=748121 RepID=UPI001D053D1F|nr:uncharacterized protein KVR01_003991 [Diaporthe batatas]KAG8168302.1 hypothetical protein KVR01_003991 [Diaporthe batatas]